MFSKSSALSEASVSRGSPNSAPCVKLFRLTVVKSLGARWVFQATQSTGCLICKSRLHQKVRD